MSVPISVAHCFIALVNIAYVCWCDANMTAEKKSLLKKIAGRESLESCDACAGWRTCENVHSGNNVITCANDKVFMCTCYRGLHLCYINVETSCLITLSFFFFKSSELFKI